MNKKGEILVIAIILASLLVLILLFVIIIEYFQINAVLNDIKSSVFYIAQNGLLAYSSELPLEVYNVDNFKLKSIISELIVKNHILNSNKVQGIDIKEVTLYSKKEECLSHSNNLYDSPYIHIVLQIAFKPIVNIFESNNKEFKIHQDVKLSLMQY